MERALTAETEHLRKQVGASAARTAQQGLVDEAQRLEASNRATVAQAVREGMMMMP
jgi:hypothetical protein|eukprot:SAG25_NODE_1101_length_3981_cov_5.852396_1_plen_56_part_00